jgi:acyl-coenzyme A thioesterase PaaI-like protein
MPKGADQALLDSYMGPTMLSTLEKGVGQTTLEFKISLVRPITAETGPITAEGVVLRPRVGTAEGRITVCDWPANRVPAKLLRSRRTPPSL